MDNIKQIKITLPMAIIIAGFLIMIGILLTKNNSNSAKTEENKSLSEQVGVDKDNFKKCLKETDIQKLVEDTSKSAELAMKNVPEDQRGTPYAVIIGKNGVKTEVRGAYTLEEMKTLVNEINSGKATNPYTGEVPEATSSDHIMGNIDAPVVVIEYSDFECPYCKKFGGVMKQLVEESDGQVAWVYRHWIVHQGAVSKTAAAECVAKLGGEKAYWEYSNLLFGLIKTSEDQAQEELDRL